MTENKNITVPQVIHQSPKFGGQYTTCVPEDAETIPYNEICTTVQKTSVLAPDFMVHDPEASKVRCPNCSIEIPPLEHGSFCRCVGCGLQMQLWGNGLSIWR